ncbi:MAG: hypothetical protein HY657_09950 [Acidobacteria bacterium]|nr:hypothetical protein [Acidobacteriota bacterium]
MTARVAIAAAFAAVYLAAIGAAGGQPQTPAAATPEARAVAYLAAEVPRWRREHPCYSCHNNGDAARALMSASGLGHRIGNALDDTLAWIVTPERWDSNARRGGSEELPLARIQFATTLASMVAWGRASQDALDEAAARLVGHQQEDGSWRLSDTQIIGGATFYGTSLATALARRVLARASTEDVQRPLALADAWLRTAAPAAVLDASAILLGLERDGDPEAVAQRQRCLELLERGQGPDGGWGPYVTSPSDVFDTALALMALVAVRNVEALYAPPYAEREIEKAIARARQYLLSMQNPDGSWPETTRPPNGESYAQRISTTAWALQALLVTP